MLKVSTNFATFPGFVWSYGLKMPLETQSPSPVLAPGRAFHKIRHRTWEDCYFTFPGPPADGAHGIHPSLREGGALVAEVHHFGDERAIASAREEIRTGLFDAPETALLLKKGAPGGVQVRTLSGVSSTPLLDEGLVIGRCFEDSDAKYCILGNLRPRNPSAAPGEQTLDVLQRIQMALESVDMDFRHVVRTWFYNDRILDWYAEFNTARSEFFERHGITLIPASTGIGVSNTAGAALVAKAIAVAPKNQTVSIRRVESPLQSEASNYGSAFSRALEVADRAARVLYISGTASIEANGETAHVGDAAKQIEKTVEVAEAILARNGMSLSDTVRAIGYFRRREHIPLWHQYCRNRDLSAFPIILTECEVCRRDLLFEIEIDAARAV